MGPILESLFYFIGLCASWSVFVPIPCCLDDYSFVERLKSGIMMPPALVFFKIPLAIRGLLWFHMNFRIVCSSFEKNGSAILIGIALNV